jgi:hypothetical protein
VLICITEGIFCDVTDEASADLKRQIDERRENHRQLLEDLDTILEQVSLIWQRIGKACASSFRASNIYNSLTIDLYPSGK